MAAGGGLPALSREEMARYSRHLILPEVGVEGQRRLKAARVLIVGAGGLGSPAALYLAAAGVGTLGLAEFDTVDVTNLQRQVLYGAGDVGRPKLDVAMERLRRLNPHVEVVGHAVRLTSANAPGILAGYDVVLDGTDNFPTRYLLNDACVLLGKPYVYGAIHRFEGQVSVFATPGGPCYRCLFREPPPPGLVPGCAEAGVLGVLPGIIGTLQALEAIKLIIGAGQTLAGRLLLFDALALRWRDLRLHRNPECPACGDAPTITQLIDYEEFCGLRPAVEGPGTITARELRRRLENGERLAIVDVREPLEWETGNLGRWGARLIPLDTLPDRLGELDPAVETVVYCHSGQRSATAAAWLHDAGFRAVRNLEGGIVAWNREEEAGARPVSP